MRHLPALLILLCISFSLKAEQWFESNILGMELKEISEPSLEGWVLQKNGENETSRVLFLDGEEQKRWEKTQSNGIRTERFYREGLLFSESVYNSNNRLEEEMFWNSGSLERKRVYQYIQENLLERSSYNGKGELLFTDRIRLREDGSLLSLFRRNGSDFHQNWSPPATSGGDWALRNGTGRLTLYNSRGFPEEIQQLEEGQLIKKELRYYNERDQHISSEIVFPLSDEKVLREYNQNQQPVLEQLYHEDILVSRISFRYTDSNLVEKILEGQGPKQRWKYYYDGDQLLLEEYYRGDQLIRRKETGAAEPTLEQ